MTAMIVPVLCGAVVSYFAWSAFHGPRGLTELGAVQAKLSIRQAQLQALTRERSQLEHRIHLLESGSVDPDMVSEVAHNQLMEGVGGEVAVPRHAH